VEPTRRRRADTRSHPESREMGEHRHAPPVGPWRPPQRQRTARRCRCATGRSFGMCKTRPVRVSAERYPEKHGDALGQARHVDLAMDRFQEARAFHRKAQWISELKTQRLGEVYETSGRFENAAAVFETAEDLMGGSQRVIAIIVFSENRSLRKEIRTQGRAAMPPQTLDARAPPP
jgi:hypothetical protein